MDRSRKNLAAARETGIPVGLDEIIDCLPGGILAFDAEGRANFANPAALDLIDFYDPLGRGLAEIIDGAAKFGRLTAASAGRLIGWSQGEMDEPCTAGAPDGRTLAFSARTLGDGRRLILFDDVTQHLRSAEAAFRDPLTGLSNRADFRLRLEEAIAHFKRTGQSAAVLCIDLDRFKSVNDTLGHPMGDALLKAVSDRIQTVLRGNDVVARLGGDEFAILQPGAELPQAAEGLAGRLVDLIGRAYVLNGHMINIGASIGVAMIPADGLDPDDLIKNADLALYRAKADGRGMFRFFEVEMDARMQARRSLEIDLRAALALKEFELAFQPQIDAESGAVKGFEALIRWPHPRRGFVSPANFIPLAEEIGVIHAIGEWVLRTACKTAAGWSQPVSVAVNVSSVQFRGGQLVGMVMSALAASGLDPARLELEITESALLDDTDLVLTALHQLRDLGVRISMDDFGTGYSSLSYLQKFPFTKIKIDQSFVRQMGDNPDCAAIVRAIAALGASLGMRTTAEGVETQDQFEQVRQEGCTEIQGYLTGRPMNAAAAADLLDTTLNILQQGKPE